MSAVVEQGTTTTNQSGVSAQHPLFQAFVRDWKQMRDSYRGERIVKEKGQLYLPATSGMVADGMQNANAPGFKAYKAYLTRAVFPDIVNDAVETMLGVMHHKPPTIELPEKLAPLREKATLRDESLAMLLRRINEEQLVTGRLGLLLDLPAVEAKGAEVLPYIAFYAAEKIINWDEGRRDGIVVDNINLVALDESEYERKQDFTWEWENKYRILTLGDPNTVEPGSDGSVTNQAEGTGRYMVGVFRDEQATFNMETMTEPMLRGQKLEEIPFVFINSKDVVAEPDDPPLLGLSNIAFTIYRGEADYRQALFMQGQDTLVVIGAGDSDEFRTGANASITLPVGGDAKFIGVDSAGLPEMREALENDRAQAATKGGQLLDSVSKQKESGEALNIRVAARTATLNQVALAGAFGLEQLLRMCARWAGADEEQVVVTPNLDFVDNQLDGKQLTELMTAKTLGAPMSLQSVHNQMAERGLTEMEFEAEVALIEGEPMLGSMGSTDEDGPEPDDDDGEQ